MQSIAFKPCWRSLLLGALACVSAAPCDAAETSASPIYSRSSRFRIPYQIDAAEIDRLEAIQIQLHVSSDQGRHWRHVDSVPTVEGRFTFESTSDGIYWFAVRTVDRAGDLHPAGPLQPGLIVVVDSTPPRFALDVKRIPQGRLMTMWTVEEEHLNPDSLQLEYRSAGAPEWIALSPDGKAGQLIWDMPSSGVSEIRARIADWAGNESTATKSLMPDPTTPAQLAETGQAPTTPLLAQESDPGIVADEPAIEDQASIDIGPAPETAIGTPHESDRSQGSQPEWTTVIRAEPPLPASEAEPIRWVNSVQFALEYERSELEEASAARVDLYLTEDGGAKWFHYGEDPDGSSPIEVVVPHAGTYGFALRVRGPQGQPELPPQPGDRPRLTVEVDQSPPRVLLHPLQITREGGSARVLVEWTAQDEWLPEYPISLSFAETPDGPWQPVTSWQPNLGQYLWELTPDVPEQIYVRIRVRDAAGNIAQAISEKPLTIHRQQPTARLLDAKPIRQ